LSEIKEITGSILNEMQGDINDAVARGDTIEGTKDTTAEVKGKTMTY
jgi:hypothetical protein